MPIDHGVILSVDTSGSVGGCRTYWEQIQTILEEIKPNLKNVPIVGWHSCSTSFTYDDFMTKYVKACRGDGGTQPECMVQVLAEVVKKNEIKSFELIVTTDGEMYQGSTEEYCDRMKKSEFYSKITNVRAYFIGNPQSMNTNITHAFGDIPVKIAINEHEIVAKKNLELLQDERFTNFKMENASSLIDDLAVQLSVLPNTQENKSAVRRMLDQIKEKYLAELFAIEGEPDKRDPAQVIHDYLTEWKIDELKKYYLDLFAKQKENTLDKKINKLYSLLHKDHVQCYDLLCFIPSALNTDFVRDQFAESEGPEDEEVDNDNFDNRDRFCAIYGIESSLPVLQFQWMPLYKVLTEGRTTLDGTESKLVRCPLQIFEYLIVEKLNEALLADYVSAEAFVELFKVENDYYNSYSFKSTCNTQAFGIMLYNYPASDNDLYSDKNSELFKEKTELDKNIVNHICCIIANYFLCSRYIRGNKGLWAIAFLYSLYNTKRIQENEMLKRCVRYTIIRISLVFKCNVTLFKGVQPQINVSIHDALLCSLHVGSTVFQTDNNIARRLDVSGPIYAEMMKKIFNQEIPKEVCFDDWFSWKYLFKVSKDMRYRNALDPIVKTKIQDWIKTQNGPFLLENKTNEEIFDEAIKKSKMKVLYRMVKILQNKEIQPTKGFNFFKMKVDIPADIDKTKTRSPCEIDQHKHIHVCKSTCRPTFLCRQTGKPWHECVPGSLRDTPVSFHNLYGKYVRKIKKFPTTEEFMAFLVKKFPGEVYYKNSKEILDTVTEQFNELKLDPKTFKKRYNSSTNEDRRIKMEADCTCPAHGNISQKA